MTTDLPVPTTTAARSRPADLHRAPPRQAPAPSGRPDPGRAQGGRRRAGPPGLPGQAALDALLRAARRLTRGHDRPAQGRARRPRRGPAADAADAARAAHRRRRCDHQVRVAAARRSDRRVGPHALPQAGDDLHLQPGRLRHELPVLRHRPGGPDPQHVHRRDRRAGGLGRAPAASRRAGGRHRRGPRGAAARLQRRVHGDGRGPGQLQGGHRRDPPPHRPRA